MNRKKRILLVDDTEFIREEMTELLEDKFDIITAVDGEDAFQILSKEYKTISLILLDLMMPNCDGYEFLVRKKMNPAISGIPVIVMTSESSAEVEERCLQLGAMDFLTKNTHAGIVKKRADNLIRMNEAINFAGRIEIDELTGLYTRQAFMEYTTQLISQHSDVKYDVVLMDIQNFKLITNIFGEAVSTELLRAFSQISQELIINGIGGRYGSDAIIFLNNSRDTDYKELIEKLTKILEEKFPIPHIVIKAGIYCDVDTSLQTAVICDYVTIALNSVKSNYERSIAYFDGEMSQKLLREKKYVARFDEAIDNREFIVWYQPKMDADSDSIIGAEALIRWKRESGYISPPSEFLSVFEENGQVVRLDEYVFRTVCAQQKEWLEKGKKLMPISVNLSRKSINHAGRAAMYKKIAEEAGIPIEFIPVEITESAAVGSVEIKKYFDEFHDAGFSLQMDDFGAGRSSLNSLNQLHFDVVKFDKCLIDSIGERRGELILKYSMALAKELGLKIIAEGVEEEQQVKFLRENGCECIQGYYFSKPLPKEEFEKFAKKYVDKQM